MKENKAERFEIILQTVSVKEQAFSLGIKIFIYD